MIHIRKSNSTDANEIWEILKSIIHEGDSLAYSPQSTKEQMLGYWFDKNKHTYTALLDGKIVGTFFIQDNQPGLGSHVANAGYATSPKAYGQGIGKQMGIFSLEEARKLGYKAMQFNIVVKTNERAVKLWQDLGFKIIGEIPEAFQHRSLGLVNAYIMYQKL
ncbi:MAG TPA: GNAT family N-acetyltransferase [Cyclobacteriaceae bacterium]|nr:GNAT family N-acetyltransferase [Cyclobacteriaceae bacterium]